MPPNKRHAKATDTEHRGRVTVPRDPTVIPRAPIDGLPPVPKPQAQKQKQANPASTRSNPATSRYTPPRKAVRLRPGWHKGVGLALVAVGFTIVILNILMGGGSDLKLLPGGHSELYLFLGIAMAAYSIWWFGWFDREQ